VYPKPHITLTDGNVVDRESVALQKLRLNRARLRKCLPPKPLHIEKLVHGALCSGGQIGFLGVRSRLSAADLPGWLSPR